jgi:guanylate kinase
MTYCSNTYMINKPRNKAGKLIIFSAPSGSGKTTIVHNLLKRGLPLEFSISACTREPRENEKDGKDYYFISVYDFKKKVKNKEFIEWEEVYPGKFYGTLKSELERIWNAENNVVFDVDVAGGLNLKKQFGNNAFAIFVMPPAIEELEKRLKKRGTDSASQIHTRLKKARKELTFASSFDFVLINTDLDKAVEQTFEEVIKFLGKQAPGSGF